LKHYSYIRHCIHQDETLQLQLLHMRDIHRNQKHFESTESEDGAKCVLTQPLEPGNPYRITKMEAEELIYQPSREFRSSSHAAYVNKPIALPKVVYCYNGTASMEQFNVEWKLVGDDRQPFYQSTGKWGHVLYRDEHREKWVVSEKKHMNKSEHIAWNNDASKNPTQMEHPWFVYKIDEKTGDKTDAQTEIHFEAKKLSKRELALTELITTEITYLHNLHKLRDEYILPLTIVGSPSIARSPAQSARGSISIQATQFEFKAGLPKEVETLLSQIPGLIQIHEDFLIRLKTVNERFDDDSVKFGVIFQKVFPQMKIYSIYYKHYKAGENYFTNRDDGGGHDVMQLLSNPIQRPPRYTLLLKEILKRTDQSHPDHANLTSALDKIKSVVATLNSKMHDDAIKERTMRVILEDLRMTELVLPSRKFNRSTEVSIKRENETKASPHTLYLFNDLLAVKKNAVLLAKGEVKELIDLSPRTIHYNTKPDEPDTLIITYFEQEDPEEEKTMIVKFKRSAHQTAADIRAIWEDQLRGFRDRTISRFAD